MNNFIFRVFLISLFFLCLQDQVFFSDNPNQSETNKNDSRQKYENAGRLGLCCFFSFALGFVACDKFYNFCRKKELRELNKPKSIFEEKKWESFKETDKLFLNELVQLIVSLLLEPDAKEILSLAKEHFAPLLDGKIKVNGFTINTLKDGSLFLEYNQFSFCLSTVDTLEENNVNKCSTNGSMVLHILPIKPTLADLVVNLHQVFRILSFAAHLISENRELKSKIFDQMFIGLLEKIVKSKACIDDSAFENALAQVAQSLAIAKDDQDRPACDNEVSISIYQKCKNVALKNLNGRWSLTPDWMILKIFIHSHLKNYIQQQDFWQNLPAE